MVAHVQFTASVAQPNRKHSSPTKDARSGQECGARSKPFADDADLSVNRDTEIRTNPIVAIAKCVKPRELLSGCNT